MLFAWIGQPRHTKGKIVRTLAGLRRSYKTNENVRAAKSSVGDLDPDPHVFGPPGSASISQRCGSGSFNFLINVLCGLK